MLLALLLSLSVAPARTEPISPVPLHELVEGSDLIAVVRPGAPMMLAGGEHTQGMQVELVVEEVLRGQDVPASIRTKFVPGPSCPEPPKYPEGERVLAFLRHDESGWHAFASSYGTKLLSLGWLDVYRSRIGELGTLIDAVPEHWEDSPQFVEWLVRCAEEPATRWEGAYPLDPIEHFDDPPQAFGPRLDASQHMRLMKSLLASPVILDGEKCLFRFLTTVPDPALDDLALEWLPRLVPEHRYLAPEVMRFLSERSGFAEGQRLANEYEAGWYERPHAESARLIAVFVESMRGPR